MLGTALFDDRTAAGKALARELKDFAHRDDVLVLALPRGGVPVAFEIASFLHAPLDIVLVRKLGTPGHQELAMGAIASGDTVVMNSDVVRRLGIAQSAIDREIERERQEMRRRERVYIGDRAPYSVAQQTVILVDDGIATGATMRAAITAIKQRKPAYLVVAAPTAATDTYRNIAQQVDQIVCLATPEPYFAVGSWYHNFEQTPDSEVCKLLRQAADATNHSAES
ncbi:MAG: phosphoribosyltransferase [Pseudomonadales bacterium]